MLGVLLESRARRQQRAGGAALSVAVHLAIIALITMTTVRIAPARPRRDPATVVHFTTPKPVPPPTVHVVSDRSLSVPMFRTSEFPQIDVPRSIPTSLPAIDFSHATIPDDVTYGGSGASGSIAPSGILDGERPASTEWRGTELLMRIVTTGKPRYPEYLRQTGIDGTVVIRFIVDSTGRIDKKSVQVVSSTHPEFSRAVLEVLGGFRFKPAEVDGRRVAALAEMPFEFRITKS